METKKNELQHYGIVGMKWGVRRYQYKNGMLTPEGRARYARIKSGEQKVSDRKAASQASLVGAGTSAVLNILMGGLGAVTSPIGLGIIASDALISAGASYVATLARNGFTNRKVTAQGDMQADLDPDSLKD